MVYTEQLEEKKINVADVSLKHDLYFAVMNMVSTEWHAVFSYMLTKKEKHLDIANSMRNLRAECLNDLISNKEGEAWCMAKHIIEIQMRLMEVALKYERAGNREKAKSYLDKAHEINELFWALQKI